MKVDQITHSTDIEILVSIFSGVSDLQGVKIITFSLTLRVIATTVLPLPRNL